MKRGVLLFAHNNGNTDYYKMAVYTAQRVNRFLELPVTIVTDHDSVSESNYVFDKIIYTDADKSNTRKNSTWINKGRYRAYDYSPYEETLLLDTDYMINSQQLLQTFCCESDIVCHSRTNTVLQQTSQEILSRSSTYTLWATVVRFKKTSRAQQLFECMEMIQNNYEHYSNIHKFVPFMYRNDYALTLALRIVNGHIEHKCDYLTWNLLHVDLHTTIHRVNDTSYIAIKNNKPRAEWIKLQNIDFHMLNKVNYMDLMYD